MNRYLPASALIPAVLVLGLAIPRPSTGQVQLELLFSDEELVTMRENTALPIFASYWEEVLALDASEDNNLLREAFVYLITRDSARGERAKEMTMDLVEEEYWNNFVDGELRLGFLRAGRLTSWMALSYDWLYDLFTEEERARIREAIAQKGCVPLYRALHGMRYPETVTGWSYAPYAPPEPRLDLDMSRWPHILGHNNFRAIINGGLTLGLLVLEGHDERTDEWKEMVLDSIVRFNDLLKDDGSYDEAVAYLEYAMKYQVYAMEAARRHLGVDFFDTANFQGMMDYVLAMYLPSHTYGHGSLTFGDAGNSLRSSTAFWVARNARDGRAQFIGLDYSDHDLFSLLYYDPSVRPERPGSDGHFVELDLDWIVSRSGYELDDFVVGMRSGAPMNHEHGDRNSIQLKAYGEILLADHRRLSYFSQDPEWAWRGSLGHNMILVDGQGVQYHNGEEGTSHARILRAGQRDGHHFWASDATQGYRLLNPDIESVTRTVVSFPGAPAVVVLDKVIKGSEPSRVSSRWHVENSDGQGSISAGASSLTIERPHARLFTALNGDAAQQVETGRFDSERKDHPFLYGEVTDAEDLMASFKLAIGVPLRPGEPDPVVDFDRDGSSWMIVVHKNGSQIGLRVDDAGTLPEFEVIRNDFR
jgi:hypothetical protein